MPTQSVERAIFILKEFSVDEPELSVSELGRRVGVTKSAASSLLATLRQAGLVRQDPITRKYCLGLGLVELGQTTVHTDTLLRVAHPYHHYLANMVRESAQLGVRAGFEMVAVLHEPPADLTEPVSWISRLPLHCTAGGKTLAAQLEEDELTTLLERVLPRFTENTITDPTGLRAELERVGEQGFATCFEEFRRGANAIAVPLARPDGTVIAALGIVGHAHSLTREKAMCSLDTLRGVATGISLRLGPSGSQIDRSSMRHTKRTNATPAPIEVGRPMTGCS